MNFENLKIPKCKNFSGYKPCHPYKNCLRDGCQEDNDDTKMGVKILIISLDALGNVLDNSPILRAIKRKHPVSTIHWLTMPFAESIFINNSFVDKLFLWTDEQRMIIRNIKYDYVLNADKSDYACAFANEVNAIKKLGFLLNEDGKIVPVNQSAMYSYMMGNDDQLKFRDNQRTDINILHEAFELDYQRDPYVFSLTDEERRFINQFKKEINWDASKTYIGFNTGCSELFPNKKLTIKQHIYLITELIKHENIRVVLLGGREDTQRNIEIFNFFSEEDQRKIVNTPTELGMRRGFCFMDIADVVISGDSFGMHMGIALQKFMIAWFGLSCPEAIELYGKGEKLIPTDLDCSPCWKKQCPNNLECIEGIDLDRILQISLNYAKNLAR